MCEVLLEQGDSEGAREAAEDALALLDSRLTSHKRTAWVLVRAARSYEACGSLDQVTSVRERHLALAAGRDPDSEETKTAKQRLAIDLRKVEDFARAIQLHREVIEWCRKEAGDDSIHIAFAEEQLGETLIKSGDHAEAQETLRDAVRILGDDDPRCAVALSWLAKAHERQGDSEEALKLLEKALRLSERTWGTQDPRTLDDADRFAVTLWVTGERERARELMRSTLERRQRVLGYEHPDTQAARMRLERLENHLQ